MSQEYIEITERTVSEAITAACQKLAVPSERLEYEVIDPGKQGFLGIGARAAKIRARVRQGMQDSEEFNTSAIISDVLSGKTTFAEKKEKEKTKHAVEKHAAKKESEKKENEKKETEKQEPEKKGSDRKDQKKNPDKIVSGKEFSEKTPSAKNPSEKKVSGEEKKAAGKETGRAAVHSSKKPFGKNQEQAFETKASAAADHAAAAQNPEAAVNRTASEEGTETDFSRRRGHGRKESSDRGERGYRDRQRGHRRSRRADRDDSVSFRMEEENRQERSGYSAETRPAPRKHSAVPVLSDEQIEEIKERANVFLMDVFHAMDLEAEVSSTYDKETGMLTVDMKGDNMGVLIGKRGQTLDSLQYLVSLVVNKGIDGYIHVKADTENYRERRKKTLENLAKNIAAKVKRNRSSVALEPMNPYERRIIHSALQGDRYVTTYSEGEEPYRKVIVTMKEDR